EKDCHRTVRREVRTLSLPVVRSGGFFTLPVFLIERICLCRAPPPTLSDSSCSHLEKNGENTQRQKIKQHTGRDLAQYAVYGDSFINWVSASFPVHLLVVSLVISASHFFYP